ncbi:DUF4421 family protein [Fulvivirga lutea]|uniref:DUF4421 family protein n=1 Tax=Fulvivirga lutea TaxID=2810512 RepID=A0A974WFC2_9BACT|nr:DUF4421 family protein [Fulvivirga lutea]QSE97439.1 DUF4421 family protein [Fulvivirga lutea]
MKALKIICIIGLCALCHSTFGQLAYLDSLAEANKEEYTANRKLYIEERHDQWYIKPIVTLRTLNLDITDENQNVPDIRYSPSSNNFMGFGIYAFDLNIELSFKLPQDEEKVPADIFGKTESFDFQTNIYAKKWGADVAFQRYNGMYMEDPQNHFSDWQSGDPYPIRDDLSLRYFQFNGFYIFNHKKFSFRSPYTQADRQLKNQGSFLLSFFVSNFRFSADSTLIPPSAQAAFPLNDDLKRMRVTTLALMPGYTYTLTQNNFYINGALSLGPGHLWTAYNRGDFSEENIGFRPVFNFRGGFGYNGPQFFAGASGFFQVVSAKLDNANIASASGNIKFFVGFRIKEKGIMKKSLF